MTNMCVPVGSGVPASQCKDRLQFLRGGEIRHRGDFDGVAGPLGFRATGLLPFRMHLCVLGVTERNSAAMSVELRVNRKLRH